MRVAVLAWGSLCWQPRNRHGEIEIQGGWQADGPELAVEFARISSDERLTLVVVPGYSVVSSVLWGLSSHRDIDAALANLAQRETGSDPSLMHGVVGARPVGGPHPQTVRRVAGWLASRSGLDAAIWAGFGPGSRWGPDGWGLEQAFRHVAALRGESRRRALEYVRNAPDQIDTPIRRALSALS